jgi:hypothetical protein
VARALGGQGATEVPAQQLHIEMRAAAAALLGRPGSELAVSGETRAVLGLSWPPPGAAEAQRTVLAAGVPGVGAWVPRETRTLGDVFGNLVRGLLEITADAGADDTVEVCDG